MASGPCDSDSPTDGNIFYLRVAAAAGPERGRGEADSIEDQRQFWAFQKRGAIDGSHGRQWLIFPQWDILKGTSNRQERK